jgi:hypothetical protein
MNLLEIPHFGRGKDVNACVKQLLALVHGGILWMDRPVSIDVDLIAEITGFPTDGENPEQYLDDKTKEKSLAEEMKKKYGTERGSRGMIINRISEPTMRLVTKLMACKLLRKCRKEEAPAGVIAAVTQCAKGSLLSWTPYLLNLFLDDCKDAQGSWNRVPLCMVDYIDSFGGLGRTQIQWILPKARKVSRNKVYNIMAHFRCKTKEGKFQHIFYVL